MTLCQLSLEQCKHTSRKERPGTKVDRLPITCHLLTCQNIVPRRFLDPSKDKYKDKDKAFSHLLTCQNVNVVPRRLLEPSKHKDKDKDEAFSNLITCQNVKVSPPRLLDPRECAASQVGSCLGGGEPF